MEEIRFNKNNKYYVFSNFEGGAVCYDGIEYSCAESAYQAAKTLDETEKRCIAMLPPGKAKRTGRHLVLRPDWEDIKVTVMYGVCLAKFTQHEELKKLLLSTGDAILIEDTTAWHDNTWGDCRCPKCINTEGKNYLGKVLMRIRDRLREK